MVELHLNTQKLCHFHTGRVPVYKMLLRTVLTVKLSEVSSTAHSIPRITVALCGTPTISLVPLIIPFKTFIDKDNYLYKNRIEFGNAAHDFEIALLKLAKL